MKYGTRVNIRLSIIIILRTTDIFSELEELYLGTELSINLLFHILIIMTDLVLFIMVAWKLLNLEVLVIGKLSEINLFDFNDNEKLSYLKRFITKIIIS